MEKYLVLKRIEALSSFMAAAKTMELKILAFQFSQPRTSEKFILLKMKHETEKL